MKDYGKEISLCLKLLDKVEGSSPEYKRFAGKYELPQGVFKRLKLIPRKHKVILILFSLCSLAAITLTIKSIL